LALKVAIMLRLTFEPALVRPVARMRNALLESSIEPAGSSLSQLGLPWAGSSSIVYSAPDSASLRQLRGSVPAPFHAWLTGA
jgi:hypothetical protein